MKLGFQKRPLNLADWLDAATWDLVPSARARVHQEIEAHYAEAVKSHVDKGSPESVAKTLALSDLGNVYKAAKRFRRESLTVTDTRTIANIIESNRGLLWSKSSRIWRWLFSISIIFCVLLSSPPDKLGLTQFWLFVMVWACVVHNVAKLIINRRVGQNRTSASLRQLLLIQSIGFVIFWLPLLPVPLSLSLWFDFLVIFGLIGYVISDWLRVRQKLRSAVEDDLASSRTTTTA